MGDAIFKIPTPQLLEKIVTALDELNVKDKNMREDLYEYQPAESDSSVPLVTSFV
jgi:type I restriction enzyme M protein